MTQRRATVALRGGHVTRDPRLDRLRQFDTRSADYPAAALLTALPVQAPRSYSWPVGLWLDQRREGGCVGWTMAHELAAMPLRVPNLTDADAQSVYYAAQQRDPWPGGAYPGATPRYDGTSVLAGAQEMAARGHWSSYYWARTAAEAAVAVSRAGPCPVGLDWYEGMYDPDSDGFLHQSGAFVGGHCTLLHGYNVGGDYFWIWNSWGRDWGLGGRAKLPARVLDAQLRAGTAEVVVPKRAKVPVG